MKKNTKKKQQKVPRKNSKKCQEKTSKIRQKNTFLPKGETSSGEDF